MLALALAAPVRAAENDDLLNTVTVSPPDMSVDTSYDVDYDDSLEDSLDKEIEKITGPSTGEEHRSKVATAVADLLDTAELDHGVGDEVRALAEEQAALHEEVGDMMVRLDSRDEWLTFFWGPDYDAAEKLRTALIMSENGLDVLRKAREKVHPTLKDDLDTQIVALEAENRHAREFVEEHEGEFSLFGWLAKWF